MIDIVISGTLRWNKVAWRAIRDHNLQSASSELTPGEIDRFCLEANGCLSFDHTGSTIYLNDITRLEAGDSWDERPGTNFSDIFYATQGKFNG